MLEGSTASRLGRLPAIAEVEATVQKRNGYEDEAEADCSFHRHSRSARDAP